MTLGAGILFLATAGVTPCQCCRVRRCVHFCKPTRIFLPHRARRNMQLSSSASISQSAFTVHSRARRTLEGIESSDSLLEVPESMCGCRDARCGVLFRSQIAGAALRDSIKVRHVSGVKAQSSFLIRPSRFVKTFSRVSRLSLFCGLDAVARSCGHCVAKSRMIWASADQTSAAVSLP
jgi:hypothetical protein